jgi:hypothetical protein
VSEDKPEHSSNADHDKAAESAVKWLTGIAIAVSIVGVMLASLGYGVSLAAEEKFGMPHSAIFNSAFELIDLGATAIMQIVEVTAYIGRGRVVFNTSTAAVLFDPTSGAVRRVPTDGAAIDVLATL